MRELQTYMKKYHEEMNWEISDDHYEKAKSSLLHNYMLLSTEVAEVAEELRKAFNQTNKLINQGEGEAESFEIAKANIKEDMGKELADCLAYMTKFANYFEIDMEQAFYSKMDEVKQRKNKDIGIRK
ncbi:MazG nucleotide pyrophosphohydrolase domain-containing protein [Gracilibacillus orientalis]|uniref:MazG nucleotide pyrophosphohydrolase domain-containing protein n=1 Tax=Gracilibacillus orientalis TaxID=334253 RepID=A0A1I4ITH7_9BACI|nr:MazG nucleotide pyrophosphohydrolase domain-containing protein [Gracilibacillus orientalis]SFL57614.1 MazG nucleotide pyrophosphohydrolase domain-containing protein [Gracilibacillus orientalis]